MKKKLITIVVAMTALLPTSTLADTCEPSRWTITLEHLEPLTDQERRFVLDMMGIDLSVEVIDQAIQEGQVPLEAFGGE